MSTLLSLVRTTDACLSTKRQEQLGPSSLCAASHSPLLSLQVYGLVRTAGRPGPDGGYAHQRSRVGHKLLQGAASSGAPEDPAAAAAVTPKWCVVAATDQLPVLESGHQATT